MGFFKKALGVAGGGILGGPMVAGGMFAKHASKKLGLGKTPGGSGSSTQTTTNSPYFAKQSQKLANRVTNRALNKPAYRGNTFATLTDGQHQGIDEIGRMAREGSPQLQEAGDLNQSVLQGDFLGPNPHLSAALAPIRDEFQRTIAPQIDAAAVGAGRTGSGRHALMRDTSQQNLSDSMARVAYQNYGDERGRQQQAMGMAPGLAQARFGDQQALIQAEGLRQQNKQGILDDKARKFYERQQTPMQALGMVSGIGSVQKSPMQQQQGRSKLGGAIGGGLAGAGMGASFGGPWGAAIGGGLGALGGLLG